MSRQSTGLSHDERTGFSGGGAFMDATTADAWSVEVWAARHGLSRAAAYREIASGRLVARKVGARTIITAEDSAAWRRSLPRAPASARDEAVLANTA
jgi:hypothetical protein